MSRIQPTRRAALGMIAATAAAATLGEPGAAAGDELIEALDLTRPELSAVRAAADRGDHAAARTAFAAHLRTRSTPRYRIDPISPARSPRDVPAADEALRRTYSAVGIAHTFAGDVDWSFNPTTLPGSSHPPDSEWTWQLNRHGEWVSLAAAFNTTADARYARELANLVLRWVHTSPPPRGAADQSAGSRWRTLECGVRLAVTWPDVLFRMVRSPEVFPDEALLAMVDSMRQQADYLEAHPHWGGNWLCTEANGELHAGILLPEFKNATIWRTSALARLNRETDNQVYPDGVQKELSPAYHWGVIRMMSASISIAQLNGIALPEGYAGALERMFAAMLDVMTPDRDLPALNDSWSVNVPISLRDGARMYTARRDFAWIAGQSTLAPTAPLPADGKPETGSNLLPWAGWTVMRSGWDRGARYLIMDCGPFGLGHQHEDKLSFILHAHGARLVFDAGSYAYDGSDFRQYVLSPRGHNVIHVDDRSQERAGSKPTYEARKPYPIAWLASAELDYAAARFGDLPGENWAAGAPPGCVHTRRVLFVKPDWWLVWDTVTTSDAAPHRFEATFHLDSPSATVDQDSLTVTTVNPAGPNLRILPAHMPGLSAEIITGRRSPTLQGWLPRGHNLTGASPRPCAAFTQEASRRAEFVYAFAPAPAGGAFPVTELRSVDAPRGAIAAVEAATASGPPVRVALLRGERLRVEIGRRRVTMPVIPGSGA